MKKIFLLLLLPFITVLALAQNKEAAEKMVEEGIAYHDKGDYEGAIALYDQALVLDKDNLMALAEKAFSMLSMNKYDEAIKCCQKAIEVHPNDKGLRAVYVAYGNAYDGLLKTDKSIAVYNEGIKLFPDNHQLYYNKGVTLSSVRKYEEAMQCFQKSAILKPSHPGTQNAIARVAYDSKMRIPALLAYCRFLVLEPMSDRAKENVADVQKILMGNVKKTGEKSVTINIGAEMLGDVNKKGKAIENNFRSTDLILSMSAALDYDEKNKNKKPVELFLSKMETLCASLSETKKDNFGFFWEYYAPYFVEMKKKKFLETFAYIAFASTEEETVTKWLKDNNDSITKFFEWSDAFNWKLK
jgi:tetratricopeptide (TPR) repeat protein